MAVINDFTAMKEPCESDRIIYAKKPSKPNTGRWFTISWEKLLTKRIRENAMPYQRTWLYGKDHLSREIRIKIKLLSKGTMGQYAKIKNKIKKLPDI